MKRKFLFSFLMCIMCFTLAGCGEKETQKETKDVIKNITNEEKKNEQKETENKKLKLYSDDTKIVYNFQNLYNLVFYYEGDKITGMENYYDYETPEAAAISKNALEAVDDPEVEKITQDGNYVIITYKEEAYEGLTVESVKASYSYLQQVYE